VNQGHLASPLRGRGGPRGRCQAPTPKKVRPPPYPSNKKTGVALRSRQRRLHPIRARGSISKIQQRFAPGPEGICFGLGAGPWNRPRKPDPNQRAILNLAIKRPAGDGQPEPGGGRPRGFALEETPVKGLNLAGKKLKRLMRQIGTRRRSGSRGPLP